MDKFLNTAIRFIKRLHFLDYLIILAVIFGGFIAFKFFNPEEKWIDIEIIDANQPVFLAYSLKKGDLEKSPSGENIAEIKNVLIHDTPTTPSSNKDIRIEARILVTVNPRNKEYEYKNKIIKVGSPIELRFSNGLINGTLSNIGPSQYQQTLVPKILTLKLYAVWPWLADSIKVGNKNVDELGHTKIQVLGKQVTPAQVTVDTATGEKILSTDPQKVDLTLKVRLLVQKLGNEYVFEKDKRIIIGETLSFDLDLVKIKDSDIINIE